MKIIILGAGQVGLSMAEILSREANDITLVDPPRRNAQDVRATAQMYRQIIPPRHV